MLGQANIAWHIAFGRPGLCPVPDHFRNFASCTSSTGYENESVRLAAHAHQGRHRQRQAVACECLHTARMLPSAP